MCTDVENMYIEAILAAMNTTEKNSGLYFNVQ